VGTGFSLYGRAQLDRAVVRLGEDAYGVPISKELLILAGRGVALGSIYAALDRLGEIRRHWPHFCYAIVGTPVTLFFWDARAPGHVLDWLHWRELPWPWDELAFVFLGAPALLALAALSVLAAGLVIQRSFRWVSLIWVSLLRTGVFNLALIALVHYSIELWLLGGHPVEWWCMFFSTFLVAAWLGCVSPRRAREFERQAM
jgi:hypothetical protein